MPAASANPLLPLMEFIRRMGAHEDAVLAACRSDVLALQQRTGEGGAPPITPEAGKCLQLLARIANAKRILEVGTGYGYSTIWLARALPRDGELRTIEEDPQHVKAAEAWLARAGVQDKVRILQGKAAGVMPAQPTKYFDLVFIDADKQSYPKYWELALRHVRSGGLICADNVFWLGAALDEQDQSPDAAGIRAYNRLASSTPGVETLILPLGDGLSVSWRGS
ncbi:MAG: O-methyltransferase [Halobacteriales archaeon]|nr:O-methyltransferase [Halobacteriales archaeon]